MKGWRLKKFFDTEKDCDLFAEEKYSQGSEQQKQRDFHFEKPPNQNLSEAFQMLEIRCETVFK